jgi:hypothetical protein
MALLNPVVSKNNLTTNSQTLVYTCPSDKSHAVLEVYFYKENTNGDSLISVALTSDSNPANLSSVDQFIDDIELIGSVTNATLHKVVVGQGEHLFVRKISGPDVVIRVSGVEENNTKVAKAGRLAAVSVPNTNQTQIYNNTLSSIAYIAASITVFNTSASNAAVINIWITSNTTPVAADKVIKLEIPANDTAILENFLMAPNEKIFVQSNQVNTEYFVNGIMVRQ